MRLYGIKILVALLTFATGVAVSSLFVGPARKTACGSRAVIVAKSEPLLEAAPPLEALPDAPPCLHSDGERKPIMGGVLNGKAISKPQPVYPPIAKAARAQGTVVVQILVDEEGYVIAATAVSGHPLLQQAAVAAARQARFTPTLLEGQPVKVSGVITYNFVLV